MTFLIVVFFFVDMWNTFKMNKTETYEKNALMTTILESKENNKKQTNKMSLKNKNIEHE